ncbi:DNA invertase Pin-like site-specific DNA recombinase [Amycolatopsis roodepoortensis]|uniref:DNA invertase Pin-like site-specific DNA recombinase n=1 Tax=Amycolatopsis roodepoortensis TaxID=700274 RepID=A0ABR9LB63_9PSEU|nr:DNA invertase Pin-like site-specific DNA recombinase [Amycolatopsis roodepoortensis]
MASQIATGRKFCSQHGIAVVAVLVDNNLSGSRYATEERQDYNEALRLLSTGQANTLWTWENSRAQRNLSVFAKLRDILEKVGGYWAYDDRIYDMNDPDDRIDTAEDAVDAERESEKIRKRTRRGVEARAMEGLWAGPLGYGYRIVYDQRTGEAHREVDPETAPFAEAIVDRLIEEPNASVLARELIEAGVPCARGHVWRADHVKKLQHLERVGEPGDPELERLQDRHGREPGSRNRQQRPRRGGRDRPETAQRGPGLPGTGRHRPVLQGGQTDRARVQRYRTGRRPHPRVHVGQAADTRADRLVQDDLERDVLPVETAFQRSEAGFGRFRVQLGH